MFILNLSAVVPTALFVWSLSLPACITPPNPTMSFFLLHL